eukprot:TRINITY_DN9443_c0_g1_i2.p1 TRINITY_DN9443_c0_g1~~TRINITY_DN9443_c0_g1_i2.p1  ORF type:complete len:189 (-),score=22.01 TRINITY_DN9443_c0_g1_i2:101-667(-)
MAPGALTNVLQERWMKTRTGLPNRSLIFDSFSFLFWANIFQIFTTLALFWIDLIPKVGFSSSPKELFSNLWLTFECLFTAKCAHIWKSGIMFMVVGWCGSSIFSALVNEASANFNLIAGTLSTPIAAIYWILFPSPGQKDPLWSVIPSLALLLAGSIIWRVWEVLEEKRINRFREYEAVDPPPLSIQN